MDEHYKDGSPIWRQRTAQRRPKEHAKLIRLLIDRLEKLEKDTRPSGGDKTAVGKDLAAFQALRVAGNLVEALAGWAIDHQIGLAMNRLEFVPLGPQSSRALPEYLAARKAVDSHSHEREASAAHSGNAPDRFTPSVTRLALKNLLLPNPGGFYGTLAAQLYEALDALEWGEQLSILEPVKTNAKIRYREIQCHLSALLYVEYERARGKKKKIAQEEVAEAFGISDETVRTWEKRIRTELGTLFVNRRFGFAQNSGKSCSKSSVPGDIEYSDSRYGRPALMKTATLYKALVR